MIFDSAVISSTDPRKTQGPPSDIYEHLARIRRGFYDNRAAEVLAFASSWAYSDIQTFAFAMTQRGLHNNRCVSISLANDTLFVDTAAYLLQSEDCSVAILSFRGTEPTNAINWLSNTTARQEPFFSTGRVHGGFHRTIRALWPLLRPLLCAALRRKDICEELKSLKDTWTNSCDSAGTSMLASGQTGSAKRTSSGQGGTKETPAQLSGQTGSAEQASSGQGGTKEKPAPVALYVTGHSLGGALAVLAAALIDWDHAFHQNDPTQPEFLRAIYTYGAPMVGNPTFAKAHEGRIGDMLFRHIYERDIVPRMPPLAMGCFAHFGRAYHSTDAGWELQPRPLQQAITLGLSNVIGVLAWFTQDVLPLHGQRFLFSWGHHSPLNYMRTSMIARPGAEFDPALPMPSCDPHAAQPSCAGQPQGA
ncbi:hypothetical protein BE20_27545 [Sorangium cellulosum]|uniref:Fungal lipase-type domain-containing protein n=1 Tax=Sorangium cellulosum TaxID=56 RepID=A0A150S3M8_SORCE|nr:hypothetical protein BE20_27545 [Sorangium cellulosum]KYF99381.1 hypothetical protein BE18_36805 [Sorangium cellulosum]